MSHNIIINKSQIIPQHLIDTCSFIYNECSKKTPNSMPFFISDTLTNELPLLYYATYDKKIAGFISIDILSDNQIEICGYVLPDFQGRNVMSMLYDSFLEDYDNYTISISLDPNCKKAVSVVLHFGFEYAATEYFMELDINQFVKQNTEMLNQLSCTFKQQSSCKTKLHSNDHLCHSKPKSAYDDKIYQFEYEQTSEGVIYRFYCNHHSIGHCILKSTGKTTACLHDVFINQSFRSKGYGYSMLSCLFLHISSLHKTIILHVTKENTAAVNLYTKLGFNISQTISVFEI